MPKLGAPPRVILWSAVFFVLSGLFEIGFGIQEATRPVAFWPVWEALGRGGLCFLLAAGLWRRLALCRSIAMVYCLAALVTYGVVLALALLHAPVRFPASVVVGSLFQVPSCAVLFPYLRAPEASLLFPRPLF